MPDPAILTRRPLPLLGRALLIATLAALPLGAAPLAEPHAAAPLQAEVPPEALERALRATLRLTEVEDRQVFLGSGFVYGSDPVVVTNAHVSAGRPWLAAHFGSGDAQWVLHLRLRLIDRARDLAIYDFTEPVSMEPLSAAALAPRTGETLYALGAPLGLPQSLSRGALSSSARQVEPSVPLAYYQHDAATNPGSSGGPLLNAGGEVVAVNARIADGSRYFNGVAFAIPIAVVDALLAGTLPEVPELGLSLRPLSPHMARLLGHKLPGGVLVEDVIPGSLAAGAGVLPGDILLSLAGRELRRPGSLAFALEEQRAGPLSLRLYRPGTTPEGDFPMAMELTLTLPAQSAGPASLKAPGPQTQPAARLAPTVSGVVLDGRRVLKVAPESAAFIAGLAAGDRIEAVNGQSAPLPDMARLRGAALLRIAREGRMLHVLIDPAARPALNRPLTGNALDPDVIPF